MTGWGLGFAVAAVSIVELDATAAGQFMLSRPIVLGPVLGTFLGDPILGTGFGVLYELLSLNDLPVGGHLPLNVTVALSAALFCALGTPAAAPEIAFPGGALAGWAHRRLEEFLRRSRGRVGELVDQRLIRGSNPALLRLAGLELAKQAAMTFFVLTSAISFAVLWGRLGLEVPGVLQSGLKTGFAVLPWLALASLIRAFKVAF